MSGKLVNSLYLSISFCVQYYFYMYLSKTYFYLIIYRGISVILVNGSEYCIY